MSRPRGPGEWRTGFLEVLKRSGRIDLAADCAGVNRWTIYDHLKRDPAFGAEVAAAKAARVETVTHRALVRFRRAI